MSREAFVTNYYFSDKSAGAPLSLSLYLAPSSFQFAVFTDDFNTLSSLGDIQISAIKDNFEDTIALLVNNYGLNRSKYKKVNIGVLNHHFTIVPEAYAVDSDIKSLLKFNTGVTSLRSMKHSLNQTEFCFTIDQDILHYFEKTFPSASIRHSGALAIDLLFNHHSLKDKDLFLHVGEGFIEIAVKERNNLLFYNVFNYENNEDILYFLLFTMEQLNLDPLRVKVGIACQRPVTDELIKNIQKYIKQVHFCVHNSQIKLKGDASLLPQHYYFTILNQHLCEL
jgi:hypothetical protein